MPLRPPAHRLPAHRRPSTALLSPCWRPLGGWLLGAVLLLPAGCRASEGTLPAAGSAPAAAAGPALPMLPPPPPPPAEAGTGEGAGASLHWPVPPPPALQATGPVLWVALVSRLGVPPGAPASATAAPLRLAAAGGVLVLEDGARRRVQASEAVLQWRWEPLAQPLIVRREVLGPFASHESALAVARRWEAAGVRPVIARPAEWEVWAPAGTPPPDGFTARRVERRETRRLVPVWKGAAGEPVVLQGPIRIQAAQGLRWGEGVHQGPFRLQADAHGGWTLLEEVPLERYLLGVVPHEIGAGSPPAALAAQAVLARTWAVRNRGRYRVDGYHLCADTQCQVYSDPRVAGPEVRQAIAVTRGLVLSAGGAPIHAVYHASNGGIAAGLEEAWEGESLPYLQVFADGDAPFVARHPLPLAAAALPGLLRNGQGAYGADHPRFRWQRELTAERIGAALAARGSAVGAVSSLRVLERGPSGRVVALEIGGSGGPVVLRRDAIRRTLRSLPSTLFTLAPAGPGRWQVEGGGFGHGAGLSQAGAIDLARRGWSSERILGRYYPGTTLQPLEAISADLRDGS